MFCSDCFVRCIYFAFVRGWWTTYRLLSIILQSNKVFKLANILNNRFDYLFRWKNICGAVMHWNFSCVKFQICWHKNVQWCGQCSLDIWTSFGEKKLEVQQHSKLILPFVAQIVSIVLNSQNLRCNTLHLLHSLQLHIRGKHSHIKKLMFAKELLQVT